MATTSPTESTHCTINEITLGRTMRALRIENDLLAVTVLLDKGADIYELVYKSKNIDVLWKSPWGMKEPARGFDSAFDSSTAWLEAYAGGWQVLFPNGGTPCTSPARNRDPTVNSTANALR